jgi:hypothetical protein
MIATVTLKAVFCGTDLQVVQENISSSIPVEACYRGWQESLLNLAQWVMPDIPDGR